MAFLSPSRYALMERLTRSKRSRSLAGSVSQREVLVTGIFLSALLSRR
jgi:hypothetical protein